MITNFPETCYERDLKFKRKKKKVFSLSHSTISEKIINAGSHVHDEKLSVAL